ncbi:cell division protein Fic [Devosia sp. 17-2-E-8]|nr:cell division protein Fic [Devosia sp. 17-2-E-8]
MTYIHENPDWPAFSWSAEALTGPLAAVRHKQGYLLGRLQSVGFALRDEANLLALTQDVMKSSEIEGEMLDRKQVRSSLARRLGVDIGALAPVDRHVEGVVEMMLDATQHYARPLTAERLFSWHAALFPTGRSGLARITVGAWRTAQSGPMQVISGPAGRERVHFEAPDADRLDAEMNGFIAWFNAGQALDPVLRAAIAHLRFVTIHPFEDGNGRIARALADMLLARSENSPQRFYSMSTQIQARRRDYYDILEAAQRGDLDITQWLLWFLACLDAALDGADTMLAAILAKEHLWRHHAAEPLNPRQRQLLNRLLDGFEGKLTTSKWAAIARTSQDTALRDIDDLLRRGLLIRDPQGGRSTSYSLAALP